MIIEKETADLVLEQAKAAMSALAEMQTALLTAIIKYNQEKQLTLGIGEVSMDKLIRSLDKKTGETLSYCVLEASVFQDLLRTGVLNKSGIRNYTAMSSANNSDVMIFYGSRDQIFMDNALHAIDALYGTRTMMDRDSFFMAAEGKDLFVLEGVSAEDAELLDCILRKKDSHLHPFPYSVVEMDGNPCIICLSEDMEKLKEAMKAVAATFESEQGDRVLEDIRIRLAGRQERGIAIKEARREQAIVDADHPFHKIIVTADDYRYYKHNKEILAVPMSDPSCLDRIYDLINGMSSPVLTGDCSYEQLPASQQSEYIHKHAIYEFQGESPLEINLEKTAEKMADADALRKYLNKMTGYNVKCEESEPEYVMQEFAKEHKRRKARELERDIR